MTNSADSAIQKTATELKCLTEDVERAVRIYKVYSKHKGAAKAARKERRSQILADFDLKQRMDAHPENCFCDELGIEVERNLNDEPIRYEKGLHPIHGRLAKAIQIPIYICSHCGKEWDEQTVWA